MTKLTAIIPTFNEEENIQRAIEAVSFADEVIVIDSYSTDQTVTIAQNNNHVQLLQREFDDFSSQKNYAISKASHDWILILDADEVIDEALQKELLETFHQNKKYVAFAVERIFYFEETSLKYSGTQNDKVIRLFNRKFCTYDGKMVHEKIKYNGEVKVLQHKIHHYSYRNYHQFLTKINYYASLKAKALLKEDVKVNLYHTWIKPGVRFVIHYILKLGFLDGYKGFVISKLFAHGVYARYDYLKQYRKAHENRV